MTRATRSGVFYDIARGVCPTCYRRCDGVIEIHGNDVWLILRCPEHGEHRGLLADDADYWRNAREQWLKPPELPHKFASEVRWGCPWDCGLCTDHRQHSCLTLIEINEACNLTCPVCFANSGTHRTTHRPLAEVEAMLDAAVAAEGEPDVVQISGGEPTLHPQLFEILDAARQRPIRHLMINTNSLRIASEEGFAERLAGYMPGFEVYLQCDSLRDDRLMVLRGARLADVHERALERLEAAGVSTTLVATIAEGVNDDEIGDLVSYALRWSCVRGVTLQPVQRAGRVPKEEGGRPIPLTGVRRRLLEQHDLFEPEDVVPVPCHPSALAMAYALRTPDGGAVPLTGLLDRERLIDAAGNTIAFERLPEAREAVAGAFSAALSPASRADRLGRLLCCLPALDAPDLTYRDVFRVLIVRFADAWDLELRSLKQSCIAFAQPDGRMIPFETYNLFYRQGLTDRLVQGRADARR